MGYRGLFPDEYLDAPEFATARLERWRAWTWGEFAGSELLVADNGGGVVGFAHIGPERNAGIEGRGEVYGFYVHPRAWGTGAATALMDVAQTELAEQGFEAAVLWVLRDNPRARGFYAKAGWRPTGREMMWEGPQTAPAPPEPVAEVEYLVALGG